MSEVEGLVTAREAWQSIFPTGGMCWRSFQQLISDYKVPRLKIAGKNFMHVPTVRKHLDKKFTLGAIGI